MKKIEYLTLDTETDLIAYKNVIPNLICMSYFETVHKSAGVLTPWEPVSNMTIADIVISLMTQYNNEETEMHIVGHNTCFDLMVLIKRYPELLPYVFEWVEKGLIHDTLLREKLLNLTRFGEIDYITQNGAVTNVSYSLANLEIKYLNIDRTDLKNDADAPRTNYANLNGVPKDHWPEAYIKYALEDAVNTYKVFEMQERANEECIKDSGYNAFNVDTHKVQDHFALYLIQAIGSMVDREKLLEVKAYYEEAFYKPEIRNPLINTVPSEPGKGICWDVYWKQLNDVLPERDLHLWDVGTQYKAGCFVTHNCNGEFINFECIKDHEASGWLRDVVPPRPHARGLREHLMDCPGSKNHPAFVKNRKIECYCPVKMTAEKPETESKNSIFDWVFKYAQTNEDFRLRPNDSCLKWLSETTHNIDGQEYKLSELFIDEFGFFRHSMIAQLPSRYLDDNNKDAVLKFKMDKEWQADFCSFGDPEFVWEDEKLSILEVWQKRNHLKKMVTEYIPKMFYTDENGNQHPAEIIHGSFDPLKKTGRSGSYTNDNFPSRNEQNVDPRIRECTIPREGNVIMSTDYDRMELGTAAQKAYDLFGYSVLKDKINAGVDVHAYLGARIAYAMDPLFKKATDIEANKPFNQGKDFGDVCFDTFETTIKIEGACSSETFVNAFKNSHPDHKGEVVWGDFYKHYRKFAKPTGLGYPGGLGPKTFIAYAKGTYGVSVDLATAEMLRNVWKEAFPEMAEYLDYVSKQCVDTVHHPKIEYDEDGKPKKIKYYSYDSPRGMHRAKCSYTQAANGQALQTPSAEGAMEGLFRVQKAVWLAEPGDLLYGVIVINFIHDEILWECPEDELITARAKEIERIMVEAMEEVTPDVKAGAGTAAMRRWNKYAEPVWVDGVLKIWEPKKKDEAAS